MIPFERLESGRFELAYAEDKIGRLEPEERLVTTAVFTIDELDAMSADAFYDLANNGAEVELDHPAENLSGDYQCFLDTLDEEQREAFDAGSPRSAFSMYAEMRINGFERQTAASFGV